jgi:GTP-binding protein YchF
MPDPRLSKLAKIYNTDRIIPASVTFVDIAGLVSGAHSGEGLGNQFLSHIRGTNAICQIVRTFDDPNVQSGGHSTNPGHDIEIINTELALADLQTVQKRLPQLQKEAKSDTKLRPLLNSLNEAHQLLNDAKPLFTQSLQWQQNNRELLEDLHLLTMKPVIYVFNVDEKDLQSESKKRKLVQLVKPAQALFICAKLESELRGLDEIDRQELLKSYGQSESGLVQLVHAAYDVLGLQSFLTAGEKEVRAWTIPKGATAPQAAGVIHTDFERGFIAAQVVDYDDFVSAGSLATARAAGKVRTEGKDYIMRPGDVVEFKFNV